MAEENAPQEEKSKEKGAGRKWMVVSAVLVVLGVGGFFGYSLYAARSSTPENQAEAEQAPKVNLPLRSFIVNLMDQNAMGKRYLKLTMAIQIDGEEHRAMVERHEPQIRDAVLLLLSSQACDDLSTMGGKLKLKQSLLTRINALLEEPRVSGIFFTEFVVQ